MTLTMLTSLNVIGQGVKFLYGNEPIVVFMTMSERETFSLAPNESKLIMNLNQSGGQNQTQLTIGELKSLGPDVLKSLGPDVLKSLGPDVLKNHTTEESSQDRNGVNNKA